MKTVSTMAMAVALGLSGVVAAVPADAAKKEAAAPKAQYSPKVVAGDKAVQDAIKAKDWPTAKTAAAASEAEVKTDDDRLIVGQYYVTIGQSSDDQATLAKGLDLMLASNKAPADVAPKLYAARGTIAYQAKDYDKAITSMQQAQKLNSEDANLVPVLIASLGAKGQTLMALQMLNQSIDAMTAAGKPVPKEYFGRGFSMAYAAKPNTPDFAAIRSEASKLDQKWLVAEPTGAVWHDALLLYSESHPGDAEIANDVRRLQLATGSMKSANDYLEYAEAVYLRFPGEAKTVLDDGVKKGVYTYASNRNASEINAIVTGKIAADKASLAASDKAARTPAGTARTTIATADAYLGYGDNAKAIDLYKVALTKTGADANLVNMRMGIAMARAGDKPGAKTAFAAVTGPRKELADFWSLYLDHPPTA